MDTDVKLADYDWIVVSSSAGKDSQAMLDLIHELALRESVMSRVVVVHCDLGRVEWKGTRELAEAQAQRYGFRFIAVSRRQGDLLKQVEARGMWPSPRQRYCTSDQKRAQVRRVFTQLVDEKQSYRRVRVLSCMGMRAQESPAREKKNPLEVNQSASNGKREVTDWLPIHGWKVGEVWGRIKAGATADLVHPAYALGMPRLSCIFCIFSPKAGLVLAGKHNPELLDEYVRVEEKIQHKFRPELTLAEVREEVRKGGDVAKVEDWRM